MQVGSGVPATDGGSVPSESMTLFTHRNLIFTDAPGANFTLSDLVFANSTIDLLRSHYPLLDAASPDISAFREAGDVEFAKEHVFHGFCHTAQVLEFSCKQYQKMLMQS
ncbi:hypothetical protein P3T76_005418 [Phytophthora citrophthora]|uniref:Uncharacterized protein n=1 Tax=Phytophthora citrophthora TaxID=4793 RepID=A0AAD9GRE6_9STRA|nr:hypothetical protein P3T76_005418 [Phytophthora citrophthora]